MHWVGGGGEGACRQAEEDLAEHSVCRHVRACTGLVVEGKAPVDRPRKTCQNTHVLGWWWRGRRLSPGRGRPVRTLCLPTCEGMHWVGGGGEDACRQAEEDLSEHSVCRHVKACTGLVVEGKAPVDRPRKTCQNIHVLGWWWRGRPLSPGRGRHGRTLGLPTCFC